MDPDANLREQREIARALIVFADSGKPVPHNITLRLAELVQALDEWIMRGGFLPKAWVRR